MPDGDPLPASTALAPPSQAMLKAALARIAERPQELETLLASSPDALLVFDADRHILHASPAAEALFGYGRGALAGRTTDLLLPERLRQPNAPPMQATADVMRVDLPGRRADGTEFDVEWAVGSASTPSGPVFVSTVRDRALEDRALEALRASEERFRLLVEGVREYAIFMLDPRGRVSSWNGGAERSEGWTAAEVLGRSYEVFFTPEDRAAGLPERFLETARREGSHEVSGWRLRKDGTRFYASAYLTALRTPAGELRGFAKITRDLTERLQAEDSERRLLAERAGREAAEDARERIRASEERLRQLQQVTASLSEAATPAAVAEVVLDQCLRALGARGGAIYLLAPGAARLDLLAQRGHPEAMMAEHPSLALGGHGPITDAATGRKARFFRDFEECAARYPEQRELIRAGGFEASAALPLLTHGSLLGVLGVRFVERREFQENDRALLLTLSELCAQALERARLFAAESLARAGAEAANRAKDEFLAMLGHELRNPLAPIVTALHLMKLRGGTQLERERTVIERQITHLTRLVDDLLDVSRITGGKVELKRERVELAEVVARAVELSSPLLEQRRQHLAVAVERSGFAVDGDATRLAQVVGNLLNNAAKYTPPGGHITISASRGAGRVSLEVRDDGIGIDPEMLPRVFDLFTQERQSIERSQGGLGLGLAIVRSLVSMHEGTVSAFSEGHGRGSVFTVELPASEAREPPAPQRAPGEEHRPGRPSRRILVVDDNEDAAEVIAEWLRDVGHAVEVAHDGPAALQLAAEFQPEVALLDIGLPVMDGYELARRLRAAGPVRLVAVTGYGQPEDRERAREAGFDAHLIKPVGLGALQRALD